MDVKTKGKSKKEKNGLDFSFGLFTFSLICGPWRSWRLGVFLWAYFGQE
jgi:hypothetical protein